MSAPFDFLREFRARLRAAGIRAILTSGMACVHYGLQLTTKDSHWIVSGTELEPLRDLLTQLEGGLPPWRVSYRAICGAPLDVEYLGGGWSSHLATWDSAASLAQHVDLFCRPPRVRHPEADADGWATREVLAMMKRTQRERDWPLLDALGWQMLLHDPARALVHLQDPAKLVQAWKAADTA